MPRNKGLAGSVMGAASSVAPQGAARNTVGPPLTPSARGVPGTGASTAPRTAGAGQTGHPAHNRWQSTPNALARQLNASRAPGQGSQHPNHSLAPGSITPGTNRTSPNPAASLWNPSQGPTPSQVNMMAMTEWRARAQPQSHAGSTIATRQPFHNKICRASNYTRQAFKKGDVIAIPYHTSNLNPHVDPVTDDQWRMTVWGPVYSKRRMVIVLWLYERDMFCLPLYTFNRTGILSRGRDVRHEYVSVKNVGQPFRHLAGPPPIEIKAKKKDMDPYSTVHVTGGLKVGCNDDITWAGRVTKASYYDLLALYETLAAKAKAEAWQDDPYSV